MAATEGDDSRRLRVGGWNPHPFYVKTDFRYLFDWRSRLCQTVGSKNGLVFDPLIHGTENRAAESMMQSVAFLCRVSTGIEHLKEAVSERLNESKSSL